MIHLSHNERGAGNRPKIKRVGLRMTRQEKDEQIKEGWGASMERLQEERRKRSTLKHYLFLLIMSQLGAYILYLIRGPRIFLDL